jgi:Fe2+ transport system protein B
MYQASFVHPPRIAAWLLDLFAPSEQAESITGDLLEEFSDLASKSGVSVARRWYWRQTVKTIAHLVGIGFRLAPWSTAAAVVGGFLLRGFVSGLPERAIFAVLHRYRVSENHLGAYVFFASYGIAIGHLLIASMFVGCMVALAAKGREMVATMTLALVLCALIGAALVWVATHGPMDVAWMLWSCADPFAIVIGGAIVRTRRSAATTLPSGA